MPPTENPVYATHVPAEVDWSRWEIWWTDMLNVAAVHGRVISGSKELYEYVEKLEEINDEPDTTDE
jgi:hypothetical protein